MSKTITNAQLLDVIETKKLNAGQICEKAGFNIGTLRRRHHVLMMNEQRFIDIPGLFDPDNIHIHEARMGWSKSPNESLKYALELAQKTVALDDSIPDAHALLGYIYVMQMQHEQAINEGERAIALGPNHAENHALLAHGLFYAGRFLEAIEHIKKAMRLSPYYPAWYLMYLADAYFFVRRYDESIAINKKLLDRARKGEFPIYTPHLALALNYMILGQDVKGRTHAAEVLKTNPSYSLKVLHSRHPFKNPADMELWIEPLRKAGIPE